MTITVSGIPFQHVTPEVLVCPLTGGGAYVIERGGDRRYRVAYYATALDSGIRIGTSKRIDHATLIASRHHNGNPETARRAATHLSTRSAILGARKLEHEKRSGS